MAVLQSLISPWKRKGEKEEKSYCNTGYSNLVTHPSTNIAEQGLTLLNRRNMLLSLWYIKKRNKNLSHFLAKFRFPVTREDVTLLKTFTITKLSVRETKLSSPERPRELYKERAACLITKASNSSHFYFPLFIITSTAVQESCK